MLETDVSMNLRERLKQEFSQDIENAIVQADIMEGHTAIVRLVML